MKGYKGFNKGLVCRGKQYAENTIFEEEKAVICRSGMHFCENPLDVLDYYPLIADNGEPNEFAEVEALAKVDTDDKKKYTTTKLRIGAKLTFAGLVKASVEFAMETCKKANKKDSAKMASSGYYAKMASSGYYAQMASSGNYAQMASSGNSAQMASSGDSAQMASSGNSAQMASSGNSAQMASSGYYAKMASSGYYAQMASSGDSAKMASSGYYAQMASSGNSAQMASSGYYAQMASSGKNSVVAAIGYGSMAKAAKGSWITLAEWVRDDEGNWIPALVKTRKVDGKHIKAGTWYKLKNGKFEVCENGG